MNDNQISDWGNMDVLKHNQGLRTVYFERNAIYTDIQYRKKLKLIMPWLQQIDATLCR